MSDHTPGPWTVCPMNIYIQAPCSSFVAEMRGVGPGFPIKANARLIAAAPELLSALEDALVISEEWLVHRYRFEFMGLPAEIQECNNKVERIRAAIAKAKGEEVSS